MINDPRSPIQLLGWKPEGLTLKDTIIKMAEARDCNDLIRSLAEQGERDCTLSYMQARQYETAVAVEIEEYKKKIYSLVTIPPNTRCHPDIVFNYDACTAPAVPDNQQLDASSGSVGQ